MEENLISWDLSYTRCQQFPWRKIRVQGIPLRREPLPASWPMSISDQHISRLCWSNTSAPAPAVCLSNGSSPTWEGEPRLPWTCIRLSVPEIASAALTLQSVSLSLFRCQMACVKTWFENKKRTSCKTYHFRVTNTPVKTHDRTMVSEVMCPHGPSLFKSLGLIVEIFSEACMPIFQYLLIWFGAKPK